MRKTDLWTSFLVAAVITVVIRLTVYGDDCNLLVVGMTFFVFFAVVYGVIAIARKFSKARK